MERVGLLAEYWLWNWNNRNILLFIQSISMPQLNVNKIKRDSHWRNHWKTPERSGLSFKRSTVLFWNRPRIRTIGKLTSSEWQSFISACLYRKVVNGKKRIGMERGEDSPRTVLYGSFSTPKWESREFSPPNSQLRQNDISITFFYDMYYKIPFSRQIKEIPIEGQSIFCYFSPPTWHGQNYFLLAVNIRKKPRNY